LRALYRPTVEMVPQIFQIICTRRADHAPVEVTETVGGGGPAAAFVIKHKLRLIDPATANNGQVRFLVQTMFPYRIGKSASRKIRRRLQGSSWTRARSCSWAGCGGRSDDLRPTGRLRDLAPGRDASS
jgi:hypothetical protein